MRPEPECKVTRKRIMRALTVVGVLVAVQAIGIAIYRAVESDRDSRRSETGGSAAFAVDAFTMTDVALTLERPDGTRLTLAALLGRPVVLHFWATWCGPCRVELPTLIAQHRSLAARGVELLLVSVDDDWTVVRGFFDEAGVPPADSRCFARPGRNLQRHRTQRCFVDIAHHGPSRDRPALTPLHECQPRWQPDRIHRRRLAPVTWLCGSTRCR